MKRIILMLTLAVMLVTALVVSAGTSFAAPCANNPDNPHCVTLNPGGQEKGCQGNNPQCETEFDNPSNNN